MNRIRTPFLLALITTTLLAPTGCDESAAEAVQVEKLEAISVDLPAVPTLPPPPHPVQYNDGSYSVYGLRRRVRQLLDNEAAGSDVRVTGYIAEMYEPPVCEKKKCPPGKMPHLWIADTAAEMEAGKRIVLTGYADSHKVLDEAVADAAKGRYKPPPAESGILPIPTDFAKGAKVLVTARFTRAGGGGFQSADGLLDYRGHETLEPGAAPEK